MCFSNPGLHFEVTALSISEKEFQGYYLMALGFLGWLVGLVGLILFLFDML